MLKLVGMTNSVPPVTTVRAASLEAAWVGWYKSQNKYFLRFSQNSVFGPHATMARSLFDGLPQHADFTSLIPNGRGLCMMARVSSIDFPNEYFKSGHCDFKPWSMISKDFWNIEAKSLIPFTHSKLLLSFARRTTGMHPMGGTLIIPSFLAPRLTILYTYIQRDRKLILRKNIIKV